MVADNGATKSVQLSRYKATMSNLKLKMRHRTCIEVDIAIDRRHLIIWIKDE